MNRLTIRCGSSYLYTDTLAQHCPVCGMISSSYLPVPKSCVCVCVCVFLTQLIHRYSIFVNLTNETMEKRASGAITIVYIPLANV